MKNKILKLKLELKNLAKTIKLKKEKRCAANNGYVDGLLELRRRYRHMHVVYSMAKGRTLEQCDSGVGLDMKYVEFQLSALKEDKKLYVVVDSSLPINIQAVQACHVVASFCKKYPATFWENGTIVLLKAPNLDRYYGWKYKHLPYEYAEFREPDLKNVITGYAVFGPGVEADMKAYPLV